VQIKKMSLASGNTRLDPSNRRSVAVSDVEKLQSSLRANHDGPHTQEVDGVIIRRIPMARQYPQTNSTSTSYEYVVENRRNHDVRVLLSFGGVNFKVTPVSHLVKKTQ